MTVEGGVWTMHPVLVAACAEDRKQMHSWALLLKQEEINTTADWQTARLNKPRVSKFSAVFKRFLDELSGTTPQASPDTRAGACARMVHLVLALLSSVCCLMAL
jgi:hypothetical protein